MVIAEFSIKDKLGKVGSFEETFLLANTSMKVVLEMLFHIFSNTNIRFINKEFE